MSELGGERACTIGLGKEWSERKPAFHCEREIVFTAQPRRPMPRSGMSAQRRFAAPARLSAPPPSSRPPAFLRQENHSAANSMQGSGLPQCLPVPNFRCEPPAGIVPDIPVN